LERASHESNGCPFIFVPFCNVLNYKKSLELNPGNSNAADMIKQLQDGK